MAGKKKYSVERNQYYLLLLLSFLFSEAILPRTREIFEAQKIQLFCFQRVNYFPFDRIPVHAAFSCSFFHRSHFAHADSQLARGSMSKENPIENWEQGYWLCPNKRTTSAEKWGRCNDECSLIKFCYNKCTKNDDGTLRGKLVRDKRKMGKG